MTTRRSFLASALATLPCAALLPSLALADDTPPAVRRSDPGVPRQMDLRKELHPLFADVEVYRHGTKLIHGVAYDLDTDTLVVLKRDKHGDFTGFSGYETLQGGIAVKRLRR